MISSPENLALKFLPDLYYQPTDNPFYTITPHELGGVYWRIVPSTVRWADMCIQYILYFTYQHWAPSILDVLYDHLPGTHPNDFAPIFIYVKDEKMVRIVFDICHYEVVGDININGSIFLPHMRPAFQVKYFYRGFSPCVDPEILSPLFYRGIPLDDDRIIYWQDGYTVKGSIHEKAKLVIQDKLKYPFKKITTFRDHASRAGFIFHCIFNSSIRYPMSQIPNNIEEITAQVEQTIQKKGIECGHEDLKNVITFVNEEMLSTPEIERSLACRKIQMI